MHHRSSWETRPFSRGILAALDLTGSNDEKKKLEAFRAVGRTDVPVNGLFLRLIAREGPTDIRHIYCTLGKADRQMKLNRGALRAHLSIFQRRGREEILA